MKLANLSGAAPSIDGNAKLAIPDLSPVGLFVPQLANVKGAGEANIAVAGTIVEPQITGTARLQQPRGRSAASRPQAARRRYPGEHQAGQCARDHRQAELRRGQVTITGHTNAAGVMFVKVQGKNFQAANIPGASVTIEPDLTFERSKERMILYGRTHIPKAEVDLSKLPKQQGATQASQDVVVVDDNKAIEQSKSVPLEVNVGLTIGKENTGVAQIGKADVATDRVRTRCAGGWAGSTCTRSRVSPRPATARSTSSGIYKAYGQDLTIQTGRLLFAGQPINDPQVNLVATRTVDAVTAKLTVSGRAQKPQLEVSADPTMSQTQALSYLVTGKPINEVGSGEGDLVQSAASSLGGAAGNSAGAGDRQAPGHQRLSACTDNDQVGVGIHRRAVPVAAAVSQLRRRALRARPDPDPALPDLQPRFAGGAAGPDQSEGGHQLSRREGG